MTKLNDYINNQLIIIYKSLTHFKLSLWTRSHNWGWHADKAYLNGQVLPFADHTYNPTTQTLNTTYWGHCHRSSLAHNIANPNWPTELIEEIKQHAWKQPT